MKNIFRTLGIFATLALPLSVFAQAIIDVPVPGKNFIILLAAHVMLGLVGVAGLYAATLALLKKHVPILSLRISSVTALVSLVASWITGGIYYVQYYGGTLKPVILAGQNPIAHKFFMEAKEHLFLFLPFVALVLATTSLCVSDLIIRNARVRHILAGIAGVGVLIGVFTTLSGVIISGAL